jgi:serine/threonine protein kinase
MTGYVHGDIKPDNLRFSIEGENYIGKIIDLTVKKMNGINSVTTSE